MERNSVSSSMIESIGYDLDDSILEVEFKNGAVYQYYDVSEDTHADLTAADSVGIFFNSNIKGAYSECKM